MSQNTEQIAPKTKGIVLGVHFEVIIMDVQILCYAIQKWAQDMINVATSLKAHTVINFRAILDREVTQKSPLGIVP